MFHMPMSSPMMKRMFGFWSAACAAVAMNATSRVTAHCLSMFGFAFIVWSWFEVSRFADPVEFHIHVLAGDGVKVCAGEAIGRRLVGQRVGRARGIHVSQF